MTDARLVKVVLLGNSGVGKTNLALRFTDNKFLAETPPTIIVSSRPKTLKFPSGGTFKVHIWDTAGQEKYRSIAGMYYKDAQAAILVFDCTSRSSFEGLKDWVAEMEKNVERSQVILVIAGNKCDLIENEEIKFEEAKTYADSIKAKLFMTSAKEGTNVTEMFVSICAELCPKVREDITKQGLYDTKGAHKLGSSKSKKNKDKCC